MQQTKYQYRTDEAGGLWVTVNDTPPEQFVCDQCNGWYDGPTIDDSGWSTNMGEVTVDDLVVGIRDYMGEIYEALTSGKGDVRGVTQSYE